MSKEIKDIELLATTNVDIDSAEALQSMALNLQPLTEKYDQLIQLKKSIAENAKGWSGEDAEAFRNIFTNGLEKYCEDLKTAHDILVAENNKINTALNELESLATRSVFATEE